MPPIKSKPNTASILITGMALIFLCIFWSCQTLEEEKPVQLTTVNIEFISEGSYMLSGTLICTAGREITKQGVCWSDVAEPDLNGSLVELDPPFSSGEFSLTVTGLSANTTYCFRAFAKTNSTTYYSEMSFFTTRPDAEDMVMDVDGNIYEAVKIGEQIWMAENLKVTRYSDESKIPLVKEPGDWFHLTRECQAYCLYEIMVTQGLAYGGLYTWAAATAAYDGISLIEEGVQGVCPDGWHLPSDDEWKQLEMFLGMSQDEADAWKWRGTDQGGKLKAEGMEYWLSPNTGAADAVGFSALPGGYRHGAGQYEDMTATARFWSSSSKGYGYAWFRELDYDTAAVFRDVTHVFRGQSVRCVKDE